MYVYTSMYKTHLIKTKVVVSKDIKEEYIGGCGWKKGNGEESIVIISNIQEVIFKNPL